VIVAYGCFLVVFIAGFFCLVFGVLLFVSFVCCVCVFCFVGRAFLGLVLLVCCFCFDFFNVFPCFLGCLIYCVLAWIWVLILRPSFVLFV